MNRARKLAALLLVVAGAMVPAGCIVVAAGAAAYGGHEYVNGTMDGIAGASLDRTWRATLATVQEMGLNITSKTKDGTSARIVAQTTERTQIEFDLTRRSHDFTKVSIRVGIFGDEAESRRILNMIKAKLK
jgi:hypothetical protein